MAPLDDEPDVPPLGEPELPGCALGLELELELLLGELALGALLGELGLGAALVPPEAEPDADPDADPLGDLDGSVAPEELDELGALELPEGDVADEELEPELEGGGVVALPLLLVEPLDLAALSASLPHAARPKAIATAIVNIESFMCPPWLDKVGEQVTRPA